MTARVNIVMIMFGELISSIALLSIQSIGYSVGIVGGIDAEENGYPYQASVRVHGEHKCGGSLLNHRWLLTAAHCLVDDDAPSSLIVVLGSNSLIHGGVAYNVTERLLHPNYQKGQHHDDIALLKLGAWVHFTRAIAPAKLPNETSPTTSLNRLATCTGWGSTQIGSPYSFHLKFIRLPLINLDECRKIFPTIRLTNICTFAGFRRGLCYGDAGSPLVNEDKIIIGIGSWGSPCARGYPDVHTRVLSYIRWIETTVAEELN